MTPLSRSCRRMARVLALVVVASAAVAGCGKTCTLIGCNDGLNIWFDGSFEVGTTYDVVISELTDTPEVVPIMRCRFTEESSGTTALLCSSPLDHTTLGRSVSIKSERPKTVRITVTTGDVVVGEMDYPVTFVSREINGEGCGTCTNANISVDFPAAPAALRWDAQGG